MIGRVQHGDGVVIGLNDLVFTGRAFDGQHLIMRRRALNAVEQVADLQVMGADQTARAAGLRLNDSQIAGCGIE